MSTPTNEREAEIRERLLKATRGPWERDDETSESYTYVVTAEAPHSAVAEILKPFNSGADADADLIANAPADLSWLLSRIEELAKENAEQGEAFQKLRNVLLWEIGTTDPELLAEVLPTLGTFDAKDAARWRFYAASTLALRIDEIDGASAYVLEDDDTEFRGPSANDVIDAAMSAASSSGANTP